MNARLDSLVTTLLAHPNRSAMLAVFTDASDSATSAALQQRVRGPWQPRAFLSYKLSPSVQ